MTFRKILAPVFAAAALFVFAACESGHDNPLVTVVALASEPKKTVYKASTNLSDYSKEVLKSIEHVSAGANDIPDLFVVSGADLATLSEDNIKKFFETSLKGGTVFVDAPTPAQITDFGTRVDGLAGDEWVTLRNRLLNGGNSFYEVIKQFRSAANDTTGVVSPLAGEDNNAFDAISVKGKQIYYVHDIDANVASTPGQSSENKALRTDGRECTETVTVNNPALDPATDWASAQKNSVANFSNWLNGNGASLLASRSADSSAVKSLSASAATSLKADPMQAQTFVHNFTATFNHSTGDPYHYDGRYNGKAENVEVIIDVWAACQISDQNTVASNTDYYLVRTSVVCNNQQLGFKNDWSSAKHVGPYFDSCDIATQMEDAKIKTNELSPQNAGGTTSFSTGSSFSIGGTVGFCPTGPTGGISVGYSESQSSTRSIPDIGVKFNGVDDDYKASWSYTTSDVTPYWSWFKTYCDGPKNIQTVAAIFDTYTLYRLPSNKSYPANSDTVRLETSVAVKLAAISGWLESALDLRWYWLYNNKKMRYRDYVRKPCDTYEEYIMSFVPPEGTSAAETDRLHNVVKEYITDWNSVERYYGVAKGDRVASLDEVAKNYFASAKKKITDNKSVLQGRGFKGKFNFYINRVGGGDRVDNFDLTF